MAHEDEFFDRRCPKCHGPTDVPHSRNGRGWVIARFRWRACGFTFFVREVIDGYDVPPEVEREFELDEEGDGWLDPPQWRA